MFPDGVYSFKHGAFREWIISMLKVGEGGERERSAETLVPLETICWKSQKKKKKNSHKTVSASGISCWIRRVEAGEWRTVAECLFSCSISPPYTHKLTYDMYIQSGYFPEPASALLLDLGKFWTLCQQSRLIKITLSYCELRALVVLHAHFVHTE